MLVIVIRLPLYSAVLYTAWINFWNMVEETLLWSAANVERDASSSLTSAETFNSAFGQEAPPC